MLGANCSFICCSSSARKSDVAIFKVHQVDDEQYDGNSKGKKSFMSVVIKIMLLIKY